MAEVWQPNIGEVAEFMNTVSLCPLATISPEQWPQIATVAFSARPDLELIFGTSTSSRKFANLAANDRVAVTVTDEARRLTVQYQGVARQLTEAEYAERRADHYRKLPESLPFEGILGQAFFGIVPEIVRATDCSVHPWVTTELRFDPRS